LLDRPTRENWRGGGKSDHPRVRGNPAEYDWRHRKEGFQRGGEGGDQGPQQRHWPDVKKAPNELRGGTKNRLAEQSEETTREKEPKIKENAVKKWVYQQRKRTEKRKQKRQKLRTAKEKNGKGRGTLTTGA